MPKKKKSYEIQFVMAEEKKQCRERKDNVTRNGWSVTRKKVTLVDINKKVMLGGKKGVLRKKKIIMTSCFTQINHNNNNKLH